MSIGTDNRPLRVAIIGSGPAAFYTLSSLLKREGLAVEIDMFERLPTPFGLVRGGVAPDHQRDKSVTRVYDRSAGASCFRFFGNVEFGRHLTFEDVRRHYHQVVFATGAQRDKPLGIPGEGAVDCHSAADFVAWYNGHPDYAGCRFDLSAHSVAIVGLGNVALDVARMICTGVDELGRTDIADHALAALRLSRIRKVYLLGRRGPAQAAFTPPEIRELGDLPGLDVQVNDDEARVDPFSQAALSDSGDRDAIRNVQIVQQFSQRLAQERDKRLIIRFLVSPTEILANAAGKITAIRVVRNEPVPGPNGSVGCRPTGHHEDLPVGLVFRSVGYRGMELEGLPFDAARGVLPNQRGRVMAAEGRPMAGVYAVGWIKRGATGVIGTNKVDAKETVDCMVEDAASGRCPDPAEPGADAAAALVWSRQPLLVTYDHWRRLDEIEVNQGLDAGRPRVKFTEVARMLQALGR